MFEIADGSTEFRGGKNIATMSAEDAASNRVSIPQLMLQETPGNVFPEKREASDGAILSEVRNLEATGGFRGVSFTARRGEILGVFGLVGSGIDELTKTLFGAIEPRSGEILLRGQAKSLRGSRAALREGIFLVPGDRRSEGLILSRDVVFNTTLASPGSASYIGGLLKLRVNRARVAELAKQLEADSRECRWRGHRVQWRKPAEDRGRERSVGQKRSALVRQPTSGVDVGAQSKLYRLIRELSKDAAVIVMSSDCDEVFGLGDTLAAMYRGCMPFAPSRDITRDELLSVGIMGTKA